MEVGTFSCLACSKNRLKPENLSHLKTHWERLLRLARHAGVSTESVSFHIYLLHWCVCSLASSFYLALLCVVCLTS